MTKKFGLIAILLIALSYPSFASAPSSHNEEGLSFGIVPQTASQKLARAWIPFMEEVSKASGVKLIFKTAPDIPAFEQRLKEGAYDLAYMNPYHYVVFAEKPGYRAFARQHNLSLTGLIVVPKDSPMTQLSDLEGKSLAFPSEGAFAASIIPRLTLNNLGIHYEAEFVSSHDSVYRNVLTMRHEAGGGIMRTLKALPDDDQNSLRILWTSPPFPPHAFAVHPRVPEDQLEKIRKAMENLINSPAGLAILEALGFEAIDRAGDHEWDPVRKLGIDPKSEAGIR